MAQEPIYVFDDNRVMAVDVDSGKVIASASDLDAVEAILAEPEEVLPKAATHIVSPNGLKGQILGRHSDVWGEIVTVRFENGRIASFHTTASDDIEFTVEQPEKSKSPVKKLKAKLKEDYAADYDSLRQRLAKLEKLEHKAAAASVKADYDDQLKYDEIAVAARHEAAEIKDALAAYDDGVRVPMQPFTMEVAEQESVGGGNSSWLDHTLGSMIVEAEATDFDQFLNEGPEAFVAGLEVGTIADAGSVRSMASSLVRSKTAGIKPKVAEEFEKAFLKRVEQVRRQELTNRKEKIAKEAAVEEDFDGPSEGLFW